MKTTSKFLGITLNQSILKTLFDSLKEYSKKNNLQNTIEIQNQNSVHITLYYLDKNINKSVFEQIQKNLFDLNKEKVHISLNKVSFFNKEDKNYICYLSPHFPKKLEKINLYLKQKYTSNAIDNNYQYIPHITVFKIINFSIYKQHEKNILKIVNTFCSENNKTDLYKSFNLYAVDSTQSPEKQKIIA